MKSQVGNGFPEKHLYLLLDKSLFESAKLFGSSWALLPKMARDGESINTHGHGFGRDDGELLAV